MNVRVVTFVAATLLCIGLVSGFAGHAKAQSGQAWKVTHRKSDALAETRIGSMYVRLSGQCKSGSSHVTVSLEGYHGDALGKADQVDQPVIFVAEGQDGSQIEHRGVMFLFGDEVAMRDGLPASFVERLAESDQLMIRNMSGQQILTVSLTEARQFQEHLARLCGPRRLQAEAWTALPLPDSSAVQVSSKAMDGQTVFLGGCDKALGAGFTGTFAFYRGNALEKVDDQNEPVTFEVTGKAGTQQFVGQLHYIAAETSWRITGLLQVAFVAAFAQGDTLTVRNAEGKAAFSFGLRGSSKAAKIMQQVCGWTTATAAPAPRSWSAMSTTAISITGDIRISENEIRFENGATLQLAPTDRPGVFRIAKPVNPVLKNGNVLCGREPPTFVAFGRDESTDSLDQSSTLYFKVYNGKEVPPASDAIGMAHKGNGSCALYNYTR